MTVLGVLQYSPLILTNVVLRLCWISTWVWVPVGSPTSTFTDRRFEVRRQISGATDELAIYSVYGKQTVSSGSKVTPFGSQGSYTDSTGLIYLINRYYDPATDQFLSIDPDVADTDQPYVFTNDDPLNAVDPLGLDEEDVAAGGDFVIGTPQPANYASQSPSAESNAFWNKQGEEIQGDDDFPAFPLSSEDLTESQLSNYDRYVNKLPATHGDVTITQLPNGNVEFNSSVPASNVPGSYADYTKTVNDEGETQKYVKTTYDPDKKVVSVKVKFER